MKAISKQKKFFLGCPLALIFSLVNLPVFSQLHANFSADTLSGCSPLVVNFRDLSTGNPDRWHWNLGNGTVSNLRNPSVSYFSPGLYSVKLVVRSGSNADSIVKTNYIRVNASPIVNFRSNITAGCNPVAVNFTDQSVPVSGVFTNWQWDFGDGNVSFLQNPQHTYIENGVKSVTLKVTNSGGCASTLRRSDYITINAIDAAFTHQILNTCAPNKVVFVNKSTGTGNLVKRWYFGDGNTGTQDSLVHVYSNAGTYPVKLVVQNAAGCRDSMEVLVTVSAPLNASFTADKTDGCSLPLNTAFTSTPVPGTQYFWTFGDSTSSAVANPVHTYEEAGLFSVKLVVKNENGCADSLTKFQYIRVQQAIFDLGILPDSNCLPFTKDFGANINPAVNITAYSWNFGDGATSSAASPAHTYTALGRYDVSLMVTTANGCRDTVVIPNAIAVNSRPAAAFSADILNACGKTPIHFTNLTTGTADLWFWYFGDNKTSEEYSPGHIYTDTGWMTVSLVATNGGCADTATLERYIYIKPAVAKFNIEMDCLTPLVRKFKNFSLGANRYAWNFGDGTTSTETHPVHAYTASGFYTVSLTAYNDSTGCEYLLEKLVRIIDVQRDFTVSDRVICKGIADTFKVVPATNEGVLRFAWAFGDNLYAGTRLTATTHAYKRTGNFTVVLIVKDSLNCSDTIFKPLLVKVNAPKANFKVPAGGCMNEPVVFADSSLPGDSGPIRYWIWTYGDGEKDTLTNGLFNHTYTREQNFNLQLKLIDSSGCTDSVRGNTFLPVVKMKPAFTASDTIVCPGTAVSFNCPYTGRAVVYHWDFGDGQTATGQQTSHIYQQSGAYTVKLIVSNATGCRDSSIRVNLVNVIATSANFQMSDSFKTCPPLLIQFTNTSINGADEYWDFGDSSHTNVHNPTHFYTYPGVYNATLYSTGLGGCITTKTRTVVVNGPRGVLSYSPLQQCRPYLVNYKVNAMDAISFIWDFNDGNTTSSVDTFVSHTYQDSGVFLPKIILVDDAGCRVAVRGRDTLKNLFVKAAFHFPDSLLCDGGVVNFVNTSYANDSIAAYTWDFGDGQTFTGRQPAHHYTLPGTYYPVLTVVSRSGCTDQYRSAIAIRVVKAPVIAIKDIRSGCVPLTLKPIVEQATADSSVITEWSWNMGNGNIVNTANPGLQVYSQPGNYTIRLSVKSSLGCAAQIQENIEAYALPNLAITTGDVACSGKPAALRVAGAVQYQWTPSVGLACDTCADPGAVPVSSITYYVTGFSVQGCYSRDSVLLRVQQPFTMTTGGTASFCAGKKQQLQASGAASYQWTPAQRLNNATLPNPEATPDSTTTYRVIGTDAKGCFSDTGFVTLTVFPIPTVDAGEDKSIKLGNPVDLVPTISPDVTSVRWTPTGDVFRNSESAITVKPIENTEYTVVVKNRGGCTASDRVRVVVNFGNGNVFVPTLFSPNHDGMNDVFYPRGTGVFKVKNMSIFNRWGEMVFQKSGFNSNDPTAGWDGTYKGGNAPADVFVYVIEFIGENGIILPYKGNVSLVR